MKTVSFPGGATAAEDAVTSATRSIRVDTSKRRLRLADGALVGGREIVTGAPGATDVVNIAGAGAVPASYMGKFVTLGAAAAFTLPQASQFLFGDKITFQGPVGAGATIPAFAGDSVIQKNVAQTPLTLAANKEIVTLIVQTATSWTVLYRY